MKPLLTSITREPNPCVFSMKYFGDGPGTDNMFVSRALILMARAATLISAGSSSTVGPKTSVANVLAARRRSGVSGAIRRSTEPMICEIDCQKSMSVTLCRGCCYLVFSRKYEKPCLRRDRALVIRCYRSTTSPRQPCPLSTHRRQLLRALDPHVALQPPLASPVRSALLTIAYMAQYPHARRYRRP